jgi:hypothetical protein
MTRRARKIETGDITPAEAAEQMRLSPAAFTQCLPSLLDRGFPPADPTTGNYALDAIGVWRQARYPRLFPAAPVLTLVPKLRDAREKLGRGDGAR